MNWMIKIKIFIKFILLFCLISLNNSTKAADYPKSYYKGKFYESIKNNFLVATDKLTGTRFGKSVIIAARVSSKADKDEIYVSSLTRQITESAGDINFEDKDEVALKGLSGVHKLSAVIWE